MMATSKRLDEEDPDNVAGGASSFNEEEIAEEPSDVSETSSLNEEENAEVFDAFMMAKSKRRRPRRPSLDEEDPDNVAGGASSSNEEEIAEAEKQAPSDVSETSSLNEEEIAEAEKQAPSDVSETQLLFYRECGFGFPLTIRFLVQNNTRYLITCTRTFF